MNPKISIIIPVYNAEKYLKECLDSVLAQTYKDFEVLLINDGSTDLSGEICDDYVVKDSRFKVFHKANGGVSSARNLGLEKALGEWIAFVDSDDTVDKIYLEGLMPNDSQNKFELKIQGFYKIFNGEKHYKGYKSIELKNIENNFLFEYLKIFNFGHPFAKLYSRTVIIDNNLRFPVNSSHGEDLVFILKYISFCDSVIFENKFNYRYTHNINSLSQTLRDPNVYINQYKELKKILVEYYPEVHEAILKSNSYPYSTKSLYSIMYKYIKAIYFNSLLKENRIKLLKIVEKDDLHFFYKNALKNRHFVSIISGFLLKSNCVKFLDFLLFHYYSKVI